MPAHYDLCVVGAGSAGFAGAVRARDLGKSVAIIERDAELAGLCILRGCMPAKTVLRSAQIAHDVGSAGDFGVLTEPVKIEPKQIIRRKERLVREFAQDRIADLESFPLFRGDAQFVNSHEIRVGEQQLTADAFLIATGSRILAPSISGLSDCGYLTSDDVLELTHLPRSIIVLGGGPVGCEFAQYFARLGSTVTLLQDAPELLRGDDDDVGATVRTALEHDGVAVFTNIEFEGVATCAGGRRVSVRQNGAARTFEAQEVMLAANRQPNVAGLHLQRAGVRVDECAVPVDEFLRTSVTHIYAAGDVIGRRMLVHLAEYCGRAAAQNAFAPAPVAIDFDLHEAHGVYTQPEVAVAGLTEKQCKARGIAYLAEAYSFEDHGRALTAEMPEGFIKMLAGRDGTILGVTIVGGDAADYIHEATSLLYYKAKVYDVLNMPHMHPTMAEIITYPAHAITRRLALEGKVEVGS